MINLYQMNLLTVIDVCNDGVFLKGDDGHDIQLLHAPNDIKENDKVSVFVYHNASNYIEATFNSPYVKINECANLQVLSSGDYGAFLDWGFHKDLLLPRSEQAYPLNEGDYCVVCVYIDQKGRPIASSRLSNHLNEHSGDLQVGQQVDLLIADESELGFKAIINNQQLGLIYHNELSQPLQLGITIRGWIKGIREDGKIDLNINAFDKGARNELEAEILEQLHKENGRIDISDKSPAETIFARFMVSKKNFKHALGYLYKQRLIKIYPNFIELI